MSRFKRLARWSIRNACGVVMFIGTGCAWMGQSSGPTSVTPIPPPQKQPGGSAAALTVFAEPAKVEGSENPEDSAQSASVVQAAFAPPADDPPPLSKEDGSQPKLPLAEKGSAPSPAILPIPKTNPAANADAEPRKLAIDMPYALRMANASNPTIALALERIREAQAGLLAARASFLPNLWIGGNPENYVFLPTYYTHSGVLQNAGGNIYSVDKTFASLPLGASINYKLSDVIFAPYIARDTAAASEARARMIRSNIQLEVALTYLDLVRAYGAMAVNRETLVHAEEMLKFAVEAEKAGLGKTTADANRARTEVEIRKQERLELEGQAAIAAAKLAQLLLLRPTVDLVPADPNVVPIALVSTEPEIEDLIAIGMMNRPELAEVRSLVAAAYKRWQQDRTRPFLPTVSLVYYGSPAFGGSSSLYPSVGSGTRDDFIAQAAWELRNLGFGDVAQMRGSRARYNEANLQRAEIQAQVAAEVTAAAKLTKLRERSLKNAQEAVQQAESMWSRLYKAAFGFVGAARQYDPLEPLIALQQLDHARMLYLDEVINFNRYQFRLYWAMGQPPLSGLPQATSIPTEIPVVPSKAQQEGTDLGKPEKLDKLDKPK